MDPRLLQDLLEQIAAGETSPDEAMERLRSLPFEDLGFAHVDHHRSLRTGYPETVFCQGKTAEQVVAIAGRILDAGSTVLGTRANPDIAAAVCRAYPATENDEVARTLVIRPDSTHSPAPIGKVVVVSAGTSDAPVAQEAVVTARTMGANVETIFDVGVAGIHRLLAYREQLQSAHSIVVAAGMEGALASVVGGLVDGPVIAVPTSVGYGASLGGVSALLTMLNSCASGVVVVNIDNGYGAGYSAALINRLAQSNDEDTAAK